MSSGCIFLMKWVSPAEARQRARREALRLLSRISDGLRDRPGARSAGLFRSQDSAEWAFLVEFSGPQAALDFQRWAVEQLEGVAPAPAQPPAGTLLLDVDFDRRVGDAGYPHSLLCLREAAHALRWSSTDHDWSLSHLAVPDATRSAGASNAAAGVQLMRFGFASAQGLAAFLSQPLYASWRAAACAGRSETWFVSQPFARADALRSPAAPWTPAHARRKHLSVHLQAQPGGAEVRLQLEGKLDLAGAIRCERLVSRLLGRGHRRVVLDLVHLDSASVAALTRLARLVREARGRGAEVGLIDRESRHRDPQPVGR